VGEKEEEKRKKDLSEYTCARNKKRRSYCNTAPILLLSLGKVKTEIPFPSRCSIELIAPDVPVTFSLLLLVFTS
jgi:hypothetical protein